MGKKTFLVWSISLVMFPSLLSAAGEYATIIDNGPSCNRVDIVILGDGYTAGEIDTLYTEHIMASLKHLFDDGEEPYSRYRRFFNVHRVDVVSSESGADVPPEGIYPDTALDASFYFDGQNKHSLYINSAKADVLLASVLKDAPFGPEVKLVTVNSSRAGGGGGSYGVFAGGYAAGPEVMLHEMGHAFNKLADEYGGNPGWYGGAEPNEVNVTICSDGAKWAPWLGYDQAGVGVIGAYEGSYYYDHGIYCPSEKSKMRYLGQPFNAVCREKIILDIYGLVRPLDGWTDNRHVLTDPEVIEVKVVDPEVILLEWRVNGDVIAGQTGETLRLSDVGFEAGQHVISVRAYDPTDWVRRNRELLEQTVTWTVDLTTPIARIDRPVGERTEKGQNGNSPATGVSMIGPEMEVAGIRSSASAGTDGAEVTGSYIPNQETEDAMRFMSACSLFGLMPMVGLLLGISLLSGAGLRGGGRT